MTGSAARFDMRPSWIRETSSLLRGDHDSLPEEVLLGVSLDARSQSVALKREADWESWNMYLVDRLAIGLGNEHRGGSDRLPSRFCAFN